MVEGGGWSRGRGFLVFILCMVYKIIIIIFASRNYRNNDHCGRMYIAWNLIWCAIQNICSSCHIITIVDVVVVGVVVGAAVATAALAYCFHHHHHHHDVCSALYTNDTKIHSDFCEYAKICVVWHFPTITDNAQPEDVEATWSPWHYIWYSECANVSIDIL